MTNPQLIYTDDLDLYIETLMLELHVPAHLKGFHFLKRAIYLVFIDQTKLTKLVEGLYCQIADEFGTDKIRVERNVRTALEYVPTNCFDTMFERTPPRRTKHTTPKEFIALCAQKLRIDAIKRSLADQH